MKHLIYKASGAGATIVGTLMASTALAVPNNTLTTIGSSAGYSTGTSFTAILGQIIGVALSFLGVVLLILVIYSGIQWMTAGGNTDAVAEAKQRIVNSVIGLVLVLAALAISQFVFDTLTSATGTTPKELP